MKTQNSRLRFWQFFAAITGVIIAVVLGYVWWLHRIGNVDFNELATINQSDALAGIRASSRSRGMHELKIDKELVKSECWLKPGMSQGVDPRFQNIGRTDAIVYKGTSGVRYVLGSVRVLEIRNQKWQEVGIYENEKFLYP